MTREAPLIRQLSEHVEKHHDPNAETLRSVLVAYIDSESGSDGGTTGWFFKICDVYFDYDHRFVASFALEDLRGPDRELKAEVFIATLRSWPPKLHTRLLLIRHETWSWSRPHSHAVLLLAHILAVELGLPLAHVLHIVLAAAISDPHELDPNKFSGLRNLSTRSLVTPGSLSVQVSDGKNSQLLEALWLGQIKAPECSPFFGMLNFPCSATQ
jgi:hypothetical protein